ncbi:hypothetical protein CO662_36675 [Rhizobium anhuiense]|uniref:Uncharacterized protein n=1 Tax=Rhizobium anhuiense TaxID=1184720 RepID=A0ABX4IW32_9HYPH|nr:hypothetical protein [Rhizobium anhuiense]PDS43162.1 hypothetical protein CO668_18805 [Rhizobium anhuiense]PDS45774.1 hypothetical protein CO662_36675 [Rhizobium anhuiense]
MSHSHIETDAALYAAYAQASTQLFYPKGTVRCSGDALFRTRAARDLGCILDVDPRVIGWLCLPIQFETELGPHVADFLVDYQGGTRILLDAVEQSEAPEIKEGAALAGYRYRGVPREEIESGFRLANARDMLRYANCRTPLNDRIRMLSALEEAGSLTVAECLNVFREVQPMTGLSWMVLHELIVVDLDEAMIGPETVIRRFQR